MLINLDQTLLFPPVQVALADGLLAYGGDLCPERLWLAYRSGIFPWYNEGEPILWWSPDPRAVMFPREICFSKSLRKLAKQNAFEITHNKAFAEVIRACSSVPRKGQKGTWISADMQAAYIEMHARGWAHSLEIWQNGSLVGGLYGMRIGKAYFGESMFSLVSNASKLAFMALLIDLVDQNYELIDCQVLNSHTASLGAVEVSRESYLNFLKKAISDENKFR